MYTTRISVLSLIICISTAFPAYADCSGPEGKAPQTRYDFSENKLYYCNDTDWVEMGGNASSSETPAGAILAFDLASCPEGWSEYTLARGHFLRGIDPTGAHDVVRSAGSLQGDDLKSHLHSVNPPSTTTSSDSHGHFVGFGNTSPATYDYGTNLERPGTNSPIPTADGVSGRINTSSDTHTHTVDISAFNSASTGGTETRPKNVAVLFCRKD